MNAKQNLKQIKSFIKFLSLNEKETELYCQKRRYEKYEEFGPYINHLEFRNKIHSFLIFLLAIEQRLIGNKYIIINDKRKKQNNKPIIFAPTHIGGSDIETVFCAIKTPCWLALGSPRESYKNMAGFISDLNGAICFETQDKKDRFIARERMAELLRKGGNLMLFPEGAWNTSINKLVLPLYAGAVDLAITCNADIVPIAVSRYDKTYYVNIGENLEYENCNINDKYALTDGLRDTLATLKWETIEKIKPLKRKDIIVDDYHKEFMNRIMGITTAVYTEKDVYDDMFKPKNITSCDEVFLHLSKIKIDTNNAFLLK